MKNKTLQKKTRNEVLKERYRILREAGYSSKEARLLRNRFMDVSTIKTKKDGTLVKNRVYYGLVSENKVVRNYTDYNDKMITVVNDTTMERWGMLTRDKRYRNRTAQLVRLIKKDLKINDNAAYFVAYYMHKNQLDYKEVKEQMKVDKNFEMYQKGRVKK